MTVPVGVDPGDPQATQELAWRSKAVARTFAPRFIHAFGLFVVALRRPACIEEVDGSDVLRGGVFAFDIVDEIGFDLDETVELDVAIERSTTRLLVGWDANMSPDTAMTVDVPDGTERWTTVVAQLDRARFVGRGPRGTDLVIAAPGCEYTGNATGPDEIRIRDIRIRRIAPRQPPPAATGRLEITLLDEHATPMAARLGIYQAGTGREILGGSDAVPVLRYDHQIRDVPMTWESSDPDAATPVPVWPHRNRWASYADGVYGIDAPAGIYDIVATCGPEYRHVVRRVALTGSGIARVELRLERWRDLPKEGWWSGDGHVHIARPDGYDHDVLSVARAEDVHVANVLAMGNIGASYFAQRAYAVDGRFGRGDHHLVSGQEDPRTGRRGHTLHMNIAERSRDPDRYFLYHETFERLRSGGAVSGYAHVGSGWFAEDAGLALDIPFGIVDVVEVLQLDRLSVKPWYEFLNLGFRLTPIAGSDFPYVGLVGDVRSFARLDGPLTPDAWFDAIRAGRTFVSNGPVLSLRVGAAGMGESVRIASTETLKIHAEADLNPDLGELQRLELVVHGTVVAAVNGPGRAVLDAQLRPDAGCWIAARATGTKRAVAHTAPIYVLVGDGEETWHAASVPAIANRMIGLIRHLIGGSPDFTEEEFETWDSEQTYAHRWHELLPELRIRAAEAIARYERLRSDAVRLVPTSHQGDRGVK